MEEAAPAQDLAVVAPEVPAAVADPVGVEVRVPGEVFGTRVRLLAGASEAAAPGVAAAPEWEAGLVLEVEVPVVPVALEEKVVAEAGVSALQAE